MKLLVVGSRGITNFDLSPYIQPEVDTIISGGASGVDSLAEQYADLHRISKYIIRPRYDLYGRAAPIKRNEEMVDMADAVLIIWDGTSKGTQHTIKYTKKRTSRLRLFNLDDRILSLLVMIYCFVFFADTKHILINHIKEVKNLFFFFERICHGICTAASAMGAVRNAHVRQIHKPPVSVVHAT